MFLFCFVSVLLVDYSMIVNTYLTTAVIQAVSSIVPIDQLLSTNGMLVRGDGEPRVAGTESSAQEVHTSFDSGGDSAHSETGEAAVSSLNVFSPLG